MERLQKVLAAAGLGSRRACEELLRQGRVTVNGQVARLGQSAELGRDEVAVDGRPVRVRQGLVYIVLHKPAGVVCTARDTHGRRTVLDLVPSQERLYPVGRLDLDSEGLVLLTNDGQLALRLMHPRYGQRKEYHVCVRGHPAGEALRRWRQGLVLDGRRTAPAEVAVLRREADCAWLRIVLGEGRKREVRRVAELLGHPVQQLIRVRLGPLRLEDLPSGGWRELREEEVAGLREAVGLEMRGRGDKETRGQGDKGTRRQGDKETRGQGDKETRGQGDKEAGTQGRAGGWCDGIAALGVAATGGGRSARAQSEVGRWSWSARCWASTRSWRSWAGAGWPWSTAATTPGWSGR